MRIPESLAELVDIGVIDDVIRPLMSGKEAQVYLVRRGDELRVAKIYKEAQQRSFRQRAQYAEGRKVKNSRRQRAIDKRTRYGRQEEELAWKAAEVEAIHRLSAAGVRVPTAHEFVDGVLVMELIADERGEPAPRLCDVELGRDEAEQIFHHLVREVCKMLCAGLVHGDLSDFNILLSADGPVIIDFPQSVDAAANNNARRLLIRDVRNLANYFARWRPKLRKTRYGEEMWDLYDRGRLKPDSPLTGRFERRSRRADTAAVLREIYDAEREESARRERMGLEPIRSKYAEKKARQRAEAAVPAPAAASEPKQKKKKKRRRKRKAGPDAVSDLDALLVVEKRS